MDCDQAYIGETARTAEECFAEQKRAIRNANEENGLFDHIARNKGHRIDWSETLFRVEISSINSYLAIHSAVLSNSPSYQSFTMARVTTSQHTQH